MNLGDSTKRKLFGRLSIAMGNSLQIAGIVAAYFALIISRSTDSTAVAVASMLLAGFCFTSLRMQFRTGW